MRSVVDSPGREEDAVPKKAGSEPLRSNALQPPNKSSMVLISKPASMNAIQKSTSSSASGV